MTQRRHTNSGTCRAGKETSSTGTDERTDGQQGRTEDRTKNNQVVFVCVYLVSCGGEAQAELPADHHGFVDAPVLAAHGAPASGSAHVHQHLHATLAGLAASRQTHLEIRQMGVFLPHRSQQIQVSLKFNFFFFVLNLTTASSLSADTPLLLLLKHTFHSKLSFVMSQGEQVAANSAASPPLLCWVPVALEKTRS